jgi:hypothetical protein
MGADYKTLLEQFGKDYRESRQKELLADIALLQKGTPGMRFDEAWERAMAANPQLRQVEEIPRE